MSEKSIYVTQPSLAPLEEYIDYLRQIWETGVMTHNGPLMQRFEQELAAYLKVPDFVCVANGTCALQLAVRALDLRGEIITTPFTFIATASIIRWESCEPVFVDIDPDTWNIAPEKIEERIGPRTVAIMPVHVFGVPCDISRIQDVAGRHNLPVIYDAAHAMATNYRGRSVLSYGDISAVSFHATKLLTTAEGGGCVARSPGLYARLRRLRFFGFDERKDVVDEGMNAKMTEVSAALGLVNLRRIEEIKATRMRKYKLYQQQLADCSFLKFQRFNPEENNYSYMPVLFESEDVLFRVIDRLAAAQIHPRRYFYPSLNTIPVLGCRDPLPVSEKVARTILCLPLYQNLEDHDICRICKMIQCL